MIEQINQRQLNNNNKKLKRIFFNLNNSSNQQKHSLKRLSISSKLNKRNRLAQLFFPTRSRIKIHQSELSTNKQVAKLNQRAIDVRTGIEHNISSLHTQRLQYLTS